MTKNNLKIFFFVDYWPLPIGGMEIHAMEFIKNYKNKKLHVIGFTESLNGLKNNKNLSVLPKKSIHESCPVITLLKSKKIKDGDVLFFNSLYWIEIFEDLKNNFPNCILIMRSGGNDIMQSEILIKGKTLKERRNYVVKTINHNLNLLIVNGNYVYEKYSQLGIKKNKMKILIGGVDLKIFKPLNNSSKKNKMKKELGFIEDGVNLLCVCRMVPVKGLEFLIHAISILKINVDFRLIIVGNGPLKNKLQELINKLKMEGKIFLYGEVNHDKLPKFYQATDIYVQTPINFKNSVLGGKYIHTETMGRTYCEAIASNLPIIATSIGGITDLVGKTKCGILTKEKDIKQISQSIKKIITNKKLRLEIIKHQKIHAKSFDWKYIFNSYDNIFNNKS